MGTLFRTSGAVSGTAAGQFEKKTPWLKTGMMLRQGRQSLTNN